MKKIIISIVTLLALNLSPVFAADWYYVANSNINGEPGFSVFIDNNRVLKDNKEAVVWIKYNFDDGTKLIEECYFDRKYMTVTTFYWILYDENGDIVFSEENDKKKHTPIAPDTIYESIFNLIW